jgi:hypothetical protein
MFSKQFSNINLCQKTLERQTFIVSHKIVHRIRNNNIFECNSVTRRSADAIVFAS